MATSEAPILEAKGLRVSVAGRPIVDGVDLRLGAGEAVVIVGPSGAGKSTLARALVGLELELGGSLRHRGDELIRGDGGAPGRRWSRLRREVQLCWQDPSRALDPRLRVRDAIAEARHLAGLPRWRRDEPALLGLVGELGLDAALLERRPAALSGGQLQRAAIARALAAEPRLLIADEISSALDRPIADELVRLLAQRVERGLGLVVITHDLALWPRIADELIVLADGRILERGPPAQVLEAPAEGLTRDLCAAIFKLS